LFVAQQIDYASAVNLSPKFADFDAISPHGFDYKHRDFVFVSAMAIDLGDCYVELGMIRDYPKAIAGHLHPGLKHEFFH
jgi:hypothetical protein